MENKKILKGWKLVKFGDVVEHIKDKIPDREEWKVDRYIGGEHFDEGEIRITKSAPIKGNEEVIGSAFHMRFKPGQVLYVTRNPRLRKGGIVDFEGVCSNVTFTLEAKKEELMQELLPFIIQTEDFTKHACNNAHGSTNPFLNWKDIANYDLFLPPKPEQKKIAEVLWSVENSIIGLEKLNLKLDLIKRKLLNELIGSKVYSKIGSTKEIKNKIESKGLIKISEFIKVNPHRDLSRGQEYKCVNMVNVKEHNPKIKSFEIKKFKGGGSKFTNGDVLFSRITPCLENGKIAFMDILNKDENAWGSTEFIILSGKDKKSLDKFVYYLAICPRFYNHAVNAMIGTSGRLRVPSSLFDRLFIENISLKYQEKIINTFEIIDKKIDLQNKNLKSLKSLRQKLINELLLGNLILK